MSIEAMNWALNHAPGVPPHLVAALMGLATHASADGTGAYPSQQTLARYTRKSVRNVRKDLGTLEALGLSRRGDQRMVAHLPADRRPVVWDLAMDRTGQNETTLTPVPDPDEQDQPTPTAYAELVPRPDVCDRSDAHDRADAGDLDDRSHTTSTTGRTRPPKVLRNTLEIPSSSSSAIAADEQPRQDVKLLCDQLADAIEANGSIRPTVTAKWRTACRLLLDKDGRTASQVANMITWCQNDPFWRSNILSMPTLRAKYDQLRLKAVAQWEKTQRPNGQQATDDMFAAAPARAQAADAAEVSVFDQLAGVS